MKTRPWTLLLEWKPEITVVILGTNDTCQGNRRRNWEHSAELESDALALANRVLLKQEEGRMILCSPPPMFPDSPAIDDQRRENLRSRAPRLERIGAALRATAEQDPRIEFLSLSQVLTQDMVVDGVHTTPFGARAIARRVAEAVQAPRTASIQLDTLPGARVSDFHGYRRHDFELRSEEQGPVPCILVEPQAPARGRPWIWRARFFGHEPELDRELLSRGYHLAYCDVSNLYGAEPALERWDRFHGLCVELGLSPRPVLEGMSRGGLIVLNWAARHPKLVESIYLDNPVCDFRSWPGGASGKRSDPDWERCLAAYGLDEARAQEYENMPLDRLESVASASVPIFLVMGEADEVVPPGENGEVLVNRYEALGAPIEVWRKPGTGHHPHGLHPASPLLRAILRRAGRGVNPATIPIPSAEYRGTAAGWGGDTWWDQLEKLRLLADAHSGSELVFLGDSITQGLTGSAARAAQPGGERDFDRFHGERGALSLGLSGDRTEHLLYRIEHGALQGLEPRVIVLSIGVNNANAAGHTGVEIGEGLDAVVTALLHSEPQAHVLISGPFPAGPTPDDPRRRALDMVHTEAARLANEQRVTYLDLRELFLDEDGRAQLPHEFRPHPSHGRGSSGLDGGHRADSEPAPWRVGLAPRQSWPSSRPAAGQLKYDFDPVPNQGRFRWVSILRGAADRSGPAGHELA